MNQKIFSICLFLMSFSPYASIRFSEAIKIDDGKYPMTATDLNGNLHVVYAKNKGLWHASLKNNLVIKKEPIPNTPNQYFWMTVDINDIVHIYWCGGYTNNADGFWKKPLKIITNPSKPTCLSAQISGGPDSKSVIAASWGGGCENVYKISNFESKIPSIEKIYCGGSADRMPAPLGPTQNNNGNTKAYVAIGEKQYKMFEISKQYKLNTISSNISRVPSKSGEGQSSFWVNSEPALITHGGGEQRTWVNTLSRSKNKNALLVIPPKTTTQHLVPIAAQDKKNKLVYILYDNKGKTEIRTWNPNNDEVLLVGSPSKEKIAGNKPRGSTAGGISSRKEGGVHLVYATSKGVFYTILDKPNKSTQTQRRTFMKPETYFSLGLVDPIWKVNGTINKAQKEF